MKFLRVLLAMSAVLLTAPMLPPCDMKDVEKGQYCEKCETALESKDVKEGACKKCQTKVKKVELCVARAYMGCHKGPQMKPYVCCGKPAKEIVDKALVVVKCEQCGKEGTKVGPCPEDACKKAKKKFKKFCTKSGVVPHIGSEKGAR